MSYADFIGLNEIGYTTLAGIGIVLAVYLLVQEHRDRLFASDDPRASALAAGLVINETLRVMTQSVLFIVGLLAIASPNQTAAVTPVGPIQNLLLLIFAALLDSQSIVLIVARRQVERYGPLALQDTLEEVQSEVMEVGEKVEALAEKIAENGK